MSYLLARGVNLDVIHFFESNNVNTCSFIPFTVNKEDYAIHHFFDNSDKSGYDIKKTNNQLQTDGTVYVAIALVEGDDVICLNTENGFVYLWLIQSGNGEMLTVSKTFAEFLKICIE